MKLPGEAVPDRADDAAAPEGGKALQSPSFIDGVGEEGRIPGGGALPVGARNSEEMQVLRGMIIEEGGKSGKIFSEIPDAYCRNIGGNPRGNSGEVA